MYCGNALFTRKLQHLKHFDRSLHVGSSDPICVHNLRSVPLTVFEIQGFKLKKKNNDKYIEEEKWTFCHINGPNQTKL